MKGLFLRKEDGMRKGERGRGGKGEDRAQSLFFSLFPSYWGRFFYNLRKWAKNAELENSPPGQEGCPKDGVVDCQPCQKSKHRDVFSTFSIDHPCPLLFRRGTRLATSARKTYPCKRSPTLPLSLSPSLLLTLSLILVLAACDNTFEPINEEATDFFAVFGFLDTAADTQFVRVSPLRETLEASGGLAARVSTLALGTGEEVAWQDSLVVLDDGETGLLFYAQIPVEPGDSYRLDVRGDDGEVTRALTQVPLRVRLDPGPVTADFNENLAQRVTLLGVQRLPRSMNVLYRVTPPGATDTVTVRLPLFVFSGSASGLVVRVPLETDRVEVLRRLQVPQHDTTVVFHSLGLEIEQLSDEWETPNAPVNIENGFGFFGSVARYVESWTLDAADIRALGYTPPE